MLKKIFIIIYVISCKQVVSQNLNLENGIYCEKPNYSDTIKHKYSWDNITYKINMVFIYDYYFIDNTGKKKKFLFTNKIDFDNNPLNLTNYDNPSDSAIDKIKIEVHDDTKMFSKIDSSYSQTVFGYSYLKKNGKTLDTVCEYFKKKDSKHNFNCNEESTGLIDNNKNLWIHPPRTYTFKILQLSPFPFYYLDETKKNWSWDLETGGSYLDPRWINYQGSIKIKFNYERQKDETLKTVRGYKMQSNKWNRKI
jgi:hypothetical protein